MLKLSKNMKYLLVGFVVLIIIGIYMYVRSKKTSTYLYPETDTNVSAKTIYSYFDQKVTTCADTFQNAGGTASTATTDSIYLTYQTCLSTNVSVFMSNICPAVNSTLTDEGKCRDPTVVAGSNVYRVCNLADGSTTWADVSSQLTSNLNTIKYSYTDIVSRAGRTVLNSNIYPSTEAIGYARKADVRGATRNYLARLCSSFYTSNIGGSTSNNPTTLFKGFKTYGEGVADPGGNGYYFTDSRLSATTTTTENGASAEGLKAVRNMMAWTKYAGSGSGVNDTGTPPVAGYTQTGVTSIWNGNYTAGTGFVATGDTGSTCNIPNWVIAMNFGPGTVLKTTDKIPITWTTGTSPNQTTTTCLFTPPNDGVLFTL